MNLYKVLKYNELEHLFDKNPQKLIVIMFSMKTCKPCGIIRPLFISISKKFSDCMFVYIDIKDFEDTVNFLETVETVPRFSFYFNKQELAVVDGPDDKLLVDTIQGILKKINNIRNSPKIPTSPTPSISSVSSALPVAVSPPIPQTPVTPEIPLTNNNLRHDKLIMLKKLYDLTKKGIKLTTSYNIDSDIDDMIWEYKIHTDLSGIIVGDDTLSIKNDKDYEDLEKQKVITNIQSLASLNVMNKQKQISCIEQLMQIKRQKERSEH